MLDRLKSVAAVAICTLLLMWPMAINRGTVLYPDTFAYVGYNFAGVGNAATRAITKMLKAPGASPSAVARPASATARDPNVGDEAAKKRPSSPIGGRSPYYGIFAWSGLAIGGMAAVSILQALWTAIVVLTMLPHFGIGRRREQIAIVAVLTLFTSLGFFANTALPDVFAGFGIAALAMLLAFGDRMGWRERLWWMANLAFAGLTHNAILATLAATLGIVAVLLWRAGGRGRWMAAVALAVSVVGTMAVGPAIQRATGAKLVPVPFLLARAIGDGTAEKILTEECAERHYATCRFLPYLPMTEEAFLWNTTKTTPWVALTNDVRLAINADTKPILVAILTRYPVQQIATSLGNFGMQLISQDISKFSNPKVLQGMDEVARFSRYQSEIDQYRGSRIWQQSFPLKGLSTLWLAVHLAAIAAIAMLWRTSSRQQHGLDAAKVFVITVLVALLANAAIHGMFSIVVGRYQSRIAWLVLFSAIVMIFPAVGNRWRTAA